MWKSIVCIAIVSILRSVSLAHGAPPNDDCANMIEVFDGETSFSTVDATTDGSPHESCFFCCGDLNINQDIWFRYKATASSRVFRLCGSTYDTKLAIYLGTDCPPKEENLIACNDDSCGLNSACDAALIINQCYTIRIGGFQGEVGDGVLDIAFGAILDCFREEPCCEVHPESGCFGNCCPIVCGIDLYCCSVSWDEQCVQLAMEYCPGGCGNGDSTDDGIVDVDDLLLIIKSWGDCPACLECPADVSNDGVVDVDDLLQVINDWSV